MAAVTVTMLLSLAHADDKTKLIITILWACFAIMPVIILGVIVAVYSLCDYFHVRIKPVNLPPEEDASDRAKLAGTELVKCAICLSEFKSGDHELIVLPSCTHQFHVKCMEGLASRSSCPVCGTKCRMLPEDPPELDV